MSRFKWWRWFKGGAWYLWRHPDGRTLWRRESAAWMKLGTTITVCGTTFTNLAIEDYAKGKVTA